MMRSFSVSRRRRDFETYRRASLPTSQLSAVSEGKVLIPSGNQLSAGGHSKYRRMSSVGRVRGRRPSLADWAEHLVSNFVYIMHFHGQRMLSKHASLTNCIDSLILGTELIGHVNVLVAI
uniref:Histone deacetylase n=1 Tax=Syphacia muris TaxID=451379 RepID=A0A0N5A8D6_9BILA